MTCQVNYSGGYYSSGYLTAYGTVTDSSGQSVYFSTSRSLLIRRHRDGRDVR